MLRAILSKSWRQHPTRHQLYGHLPPITKTIQVRRTRHAGHCRRSRNELISDVLLWTPTHGRAKAGRPARTYIQQLCEDTGCCPDDLPEVMNDREKWRERARDVRAPSMTWWWWWWWVEKTIFFLFGLENWNVNLIVLVLAKSKRWFTKGSKLTVMTHRWTKYGLLVEKNNFLNILFPKFNVFGKSLNLILKLFVN